MLYQNAKVTKLRPRKMALQEAFSDFIQDRLNRQVSEHTIETYEVRFGLFRRWCEEQGITSIADVTADVLKEYFDHLRTRRAEWVARFKDKTQKKITNDHKLARWTVKGYFIVLHALFQYLVKWERVSSDPMAKFDAREFRIPRTRMAEKFCPTVEQVQKVLDRFDPRLTPKPYRGVSEVKWPFLCWRNHTLLLVMASTALRAKEALEITMDDMDLDSGVLRVLRKGQHKDDDPRIITLTPSVRQRVRLFVTERAKWLTKLGLSSDHLFITGEGRAMSKTALRRLFETIRKETGVPLTPHLLRHFAITEAWKVAGATPRDVQTFADHADIKTTVGYSHYSLKEARAFAERADFGSKLLRH